MFSTVRKMVEPAKKKQVPNTNEHLSLTYFLQLNIKCVVEGENTLVLSILKFKLDKLIFESSAVA